MISPAKMHIIDEILDEYNDRVAQLDERFSTDDRALVHYERAAVDMRLYILAEMSHSGVCGCARCNPPVYDEMEYYGQGAS